MKDAVENITLTIHQDEKYNFFQAYDQMTPLRKKIWKLTLWWCKRFPCANPRQATLGKKLGCSRSAVNEAFCEFKILGWVHLISRGAHRPKVIVISHHILQIDLIKREYFKRIEATATATHSYSSYRDTSRRPGLIEIPQYLKKLDIPLEAKLKLSLVPEYIYQETFYQCKKKSKTGWKPDDPIRYFVGTAMRMAENSGLRIDWGKYMKARAVI